MTSSRTVGVLALALMLVLSACAQDDGSVLADEAYEFPTELVAAGMAASAPAPTTTTIPSLSEPDPVAPPPSRAVREALSSSDPLPSPSTDLLPSVAPLEPFVVTDGGQRRLLRDVTATVTYSPEAGLVVEPSGWWLVNYPLNRIVGAEGRTEQEIALLLTGRPLAELTNYYFYSAPESGEQVAELPEPEGPAPIRVTPTVGIVVDNQDPQASDDNDGSRAHPLLTISAAVERAVPGTVIHVYPGVYRETVSVAVDGTESEPIRIEGIRGASGAMPIITGNDQFPVGAWREVDGLRGVYSADAFTNLSGSMTLGDNRFTERAAPWDLSDAEFVVTTGGDAFVNPRFDGGTNANEGSVHTFGSSQYIWEAKPTDGGGFVDLGSEFGEGFAGGVYWGSAWVYAEKPWGVSDYEWHNSYKFDLQVSGPFRAGGISGVPLSEQPYSYRVWLDGELLDANVHATSTNTEADLAHPEIGAGVYGETWHGVPLREGWHHLVFQWDTTSASEGTAAIPVFRFGIPEAVGKAVTNAAAPSSSRRAPSGTAQNYVSEYMVLGPVPSAYDPTVYVRMPGDADPNEAALEIAARSGPVVSILGDFVELHGFDVRGGSQAEGESQISVGLRGEDPAADVYVQGVVVEGNLVTASQYGGIGAVVSGDMGVAPIAIRNNWVIDPGALGIAVSGLSDRLTAETIHDWAPGRTPVTVEFNTVVEAGWAGYDRVDDVSAILFERMTGSTIRYNTIVGGGPGITLRGENYGIRVDGNSITNPFAWGIGVEANPGPNLISNNLVTGLRAGPEWRKAHLLTWDSDKTWVINNTTDGEWNTETGWYSDVGTWGAGGPENFERIDYASWQMTQFRRTYVNNLFLGHYLGGVEDYLGNWGDSDTFIGNFREVPKPDPFDYLDDGAESADVRYAFVDRDAGDYRLDSRSELNTVGVINLTSELAALDFFGLPRFLGEATSVGAYRATPDIASGSSVIEVLFSDGSVIRIEG